MRATGKRIISIFICLMLLFSCTTVWAGEPEAKAAADAQAAQLEIVSSGSVVPGSTVTLKGTAAVTGDPDAVYRYIYYDGITWREIYSSSNPLLQVNWIPSAAGDYLMAYQVICNGRQTNAFQNLHVESPYMRLQGIDTAGTSKGIQITPRYETNMDPPDCKIYIYDI